jgi:hypothetical protein
MAGLLTLQKSLRLRVTSSADETSRMRRRRARHHGLPDLRHGALSFAAERDYVNA